MPGSADVSGLNVQFGALDFGSEAGSAAADMSQPEMSREHTPAMAQTNIPVPTSATVSTQQQQSSIFPKPGAMRYMPKKIGFNFMLVRF